MQQLATALPSFTKLPIFDIVKWKGRGKDVYERAKKAISIRIIFNFYGASEYPWFQNYHAGLN